MTKLLFPPEPPKPQHGYTSNVFRLMRAVYETPDRVTQAISVIISERARAVELARFPKYKPQRVVFPDSSQRSPTLVDLGTFFMEFWNMKQREELVLDETPAVWAVLMRAIDAPTVVRLVLEHCVNFHESSGLTTDALKELFRLREIYKNTQQMTPPFVAKLKTKLVEALRDAAARSRNVLSVRVFDPLDAGLLLSACETALVAGEEERKRWLTRP